MEQHKEIIEQYRTFYNKGFIGSLERELVILKQNNRNEFLRFVKDLHEVTKADKVQLVNSIPEVIRVLIDAFKLNKI
jgi:hypothetical protein